MKSGLILSLFFAVATLSAEVVFQAGAKEIESKSEIIQLKTPLTLPSGTIAFTFQWLNPDAESFVNLLRLTGKNGTLRIYIYPHQNLGFMVLRTFKDGSPNVTLHALRKLIDIWRLTPDKLHQIILCWSGVESRLYLDGMMVRNDTKFGKAPLEFDSVTYGEATVVYPPPSLKRQATNLKYKLGELTISDTAMSPEEVAAAWKKVNGNVASDDF